MSTAPRLPPDPDEYRMPLIEHLKELRSRILKAVYAVAAGVGLSFFFTDDTLLAASFSSRARVPLLASPSLARASALIWAAVCFFVPAKAMTTENICFMLILVPPAAILGGIIGMWYEGSRACRLRP